MKHWFFLSLIVILLSCGPSGDFDLAVTNARIFDSKTGQLSGKKTILVKAGIIVNIVDEKLAFSASKTIDADGRLVTPGFIDTHIHPTDVFGDYDEAPEYLSADSLPFFRKNLSDIYLPYGVTTAMIMGQPEKWLPPVLEWSSKPEAGFINLYTVGGAMISTESRKPYINHITVDSPAAARQKVLDYYKMGIRHIKLYWRLRRPEFEAAYRTADSLGMKIYGHIDQNIMFIDSLPFFRKNLSDIYLPYGVTTARI